MQRSQSTVCFGIACALIASGFVYGDSPVRKPNFTFVLSDDIAQGDLGCYGQKLIKTPRIDQMAAEGTLRDANGDQLPANQQVLLITDQEQARKQCQERVARWQAHKSRFPTADCYRFFPELSGPDRAERFGDIAPQATEPK